MENAQILNKKETRRILDQVTQQWACDTAPLEAMVFLKTKQDKYYVARKELFSFPLDQVRVSKLGMYFAEQHKNALRVSIEGAQLLGPSASRNVMVLDEEQLQQWLRGESLTLEPSLAREQQIDTSQVPAPGFVLIRHGDDFFGCGSYSKRTGQLTNYYPKIRRVQSITTSTD